MKKNKYAQELGKLGGSVKSTKKARTSRLNGKKGGRPSKAKLNNKVIHSSLLA